MGSLPVIFLARFYIDEGMEIIQLPYNMVARSLSAGRLQEILTDYRPDKNDIWLVYAESRMLQPQVRALIDHLLSVNETAS